MMHAQRFNKGHSILGFMCAGLLALGGSAAGQNRSQVELSSGKIQVRGSEDFRKTVELFLERSPLKIVGGAEAPDGAYPWQVSLIVSWIADPHRGHFCGGSIYDSKWIVTAAHCVTDNQPQDIQVVSGVNKLTKTVARTNVKSIWAHKSYNPKTNDNDIALLELFDVLVLDEKAKPIRLLASQDEDRLLASGRNVTITGWGATQEGGSPVESLRFVEIPPVPRVTCNQPSSYNGRVTENMICGGRALGGQDSCQGDSGGPLVTDKSLGDPQLAGIVSWGEGCAKPGKFGVYTRVTRYNDWIRQCTDSRGKC